MRRAIHAVAYVAAAYIAAATISVARADCNPDAGSTDCPQYQACYRGSCIAVCSLNSFPCADGQICVPAAGGAKVCIPNPCLTPKPLCQDPLVCHPDANGDPQCVPVCTGVSCPPAFHCVMDQCVPLPCPCDGGLVCAGDPPVCHPDFCAAARCRAGMACDPTNGNCYVPADGGAADLATAPPPRPGCGCRVGAPPSRGASAALLLAAALLLRRRARRVPSA